MTTSMRTELGFYMVQESRQEWTGSYGGRDLRGGDSPSSHHRREWDGTYQDPYNTCHMGLHCWSCAVLPSALPSLHPSSGLTFRLPP